MTQAISSARALAKGALSFYQSALLSYPKHVQCNLCGWEGRRFLSDSWHSHINCPKCRSGIRHRLFLAALQNCDEFSFARLFHNKNTLQFAPEPSVSFHIRSNCAKYSTADLLRSDCDFTLDMSHMPQVKDDSFDVVIAFDVLEHVPDYRKALEEVHRILSSNGLAIFTVPQQDGLLDTYEDPTVVTQEGRLKHFGQADHLRIFGDDFSTTVGRAGFAVRTLNESFFSEGIKNRHVLFPPTLSKHPLATNYRRVFFCQKSFAALATTQSNDLSVPLQR